MRKNVMDGQVSMFGPDLPCGKMSPAASPAGGTRRRGGKGRARTSARSSRRSSRLRNQSFMLLNLREGAGNILGPYWEIDPQWLGCGGTLNTSECPKDAVESSLSAILQEDVPSKYYLTRKACLGILRRAAERGKDLPAQLGLALKAQAGLILLDELSTKPLVNGESRRELFKEDCLTPWDTQQTRIFTPESRAPTLAGADGGGGRNPGGLLFAAGVVSKGGGDCFLMPERHAALSGGGGQAGQGYPCVLTAAFNAGAGSAAGTIGYQEEVSPTLKGTASGNMMPSVLCLNDQGGSVMEYSEDVAGTLRAQEHGHQPLVLSVYENHGIDARYTGPHRISPTIPARAGTGGNNLPLVSEMPETLCILGNTVDCTSKNGGHGLGVQENLSFTLTAEHRHAVFTRQRSDCFREGDIASTESAQQDKDATDLVCTFLYQDTIGALTTSDYKGPNSQYVHQDKLVIAGPKLIRRLTPTECERLQSFPDGWTDLPGASDSARYRALGNSVAIPCVEFIMRGIAMAFGVYPAALPDFSAALMSDPAGDNTSSLSRGR